MKLAVNDFARTAHTPTRGSHFDGSWDELVALVLEHWDDWRPGYRKGVREVPVPADRFYSGVVALTEDIPLSVKYAPRRDGETPVVDVRVPADAKQRAKHVHVAIYSAETLGDDASTSAEWEIVAIVASPVEDEPMHPLTMARNQLGMTGGSKAEYTADELARAIMFWAQHAVIG